MVDLEAAAAALAASPDYRVLRRMQPHTHFPAGMAIDAPAKVGLIVDVETTGLDRTADEIIELGLLAFEYRDGHVSRVLSCDSWLNEPSAPLSDEVREVTGLTDEMLAGQRLPLDRIAEVADPAVLVIAHHAGFDRPFVERACQWAVGKHWACSMEEIDWKAAGAPSQALQAAAWASGFFFDGHRAEIDCRAVLELLAQGSRLADLLASAAKPTYRVAAVGAPFDLKDALKARRYVWNAERRHWYRDVRTEEALAVEQAWLAERRVRPHVSNFTSKNRYSERV